MPRNFEMQRLLRTNRTLFPEVPESWDLIDSLRFKFAQISESRTYLATTILERYIKPFERSHVRQQPLVIREIAFHLKA